MNEDHRDWVFFLAGLRSVLSICFVVLLMVFTWQFLSGSKAITAKDGQIYIENR